MVEPTLRRLNGEMLGQYFFHDGKFLAIQGAIVCDMLLTGFDAPIEQVMYIDKKVKEHNLLQTIARVNRVFEGKGKGYIVDYIGLANHLQEALSIYSGDDQDDVENALKNVKSELPVLESRYQRLINLFKDNGVIQIEDFVKQKIKDDLQNYEILEQAIELMKEVRQRATFEVYMKKFLQSMDVVLPDAMADPFKIPVKRFGYLLAKVKQRYKDDSINIEGAGAKVRKLINEHLISLGINPKIEPVELFSDNFIKELEENKSSKAKASEMEHAIRKHCKVHFDEDPAFFGKLSEKLENLIKKHNEDWDQLALDLNGLRDEASKGRGESTAKISKKAAPFHDLIIRIAFDEKPTEEEAGLLCELTEEIVQKFEETINIVNFWGNDFEIEQLDGNITDLIYFSSLSPVIEKAPVVAAAVIALAKNRHKDIVG